MNFNQNISGDPKVVVLTGHSVMFSLANRTAGIEEVIMN